MAKDRRADAVLFGFDFQVNAAIVLMLENITELRSLRLESENEDIDIELYISMISSLIGSIISLSVRKEIVKSSAYLV